MDRKEIKCPRVPKNTFRDKAHKHKAMTTNPVPDPCNPGSVMSFWQWVASLIAEVYCTIGLMCPKQYQCDGDTVTKTVLMYSGTALDMWLGIHKNPLLLLSSQLPQQICFL